MLQTLLHGDIYRLLEIGHFRDRAGTGSARDSSPVLHLHPQPVTLDIARLGHWPLATGPLGQCTVTSQGASVRVTGGRVTSLCYEQAE